jgi:hypothetical protein
MLGKVLGECIVEPETDDNIQQILKKRASE